MPYWLVVAISLLWVMHLLSILSTIIHYKSLNQYQKKSYRLNWFGRIEILIFVPFTIFWWSWVIFG